MKLSVFLSGPITRLSYKSASDWREYVIRHLPEGVVGVSPLRGKPHLKNKDCIESVHNDHALTTPRGITTRDFNDISRCDLVLMNVLGSKEISKGTLIEVGWAYALRKPIVLVIEETGNPHDYFMVRESAGFIVGALEKGVQLIEDILLP